MTEKIEEKKLNPPYLSYRTFLNFLDKLKVGMPARIDRSVMGSFSGVAQASLFTTLKFLHLVDSEHVPAPSLTQLVEAEGDEKKTLLREILTASYPFIFNKGVDLRRITSNQLAELFDNSGVSGGTIPKCIGFFMASAKDAGIELSPHLKVKGVARRTGKVRKIGDRADKNDYVQSVDDKPQTPPVETLSWQQILASKFPTFDPNWTPEAQAKWFDGFKELMEQFKQKKNDKE